MSVNELEPVKLIAFYLPQFHPIPENDRWWGEGFTEWTNTVRARPRFRGHYQPHIPSELGFYDLREPAIRQKQADLAREHGVFGFCYYHYWFHGHQLLERPFSEVLESGEPDFPFCLCWPNENWTRAWDGLDNELLIEQTYSEKDDLEHIRSLIPAFLDKRYIRVGGKPLFLVYRASKLPDSIATTDRWREEALRSGAGELFLCRVESHAEQGDPRKLGFDAALRFHPSGRLLGLPLRRTKWWYWARRLGLSEMAYQTNRIYDYSIYVKRALAESKVDYPLYESVFPSWDNSPRRDQSMLFVNSTPTIYEHWLSERIRTAEPVGGSDPMLFIVAWNEWAEGNHLEPCQKWGRAYLEATRRALGERHPEADRELAGYVRG